MRKGRLGVAAAVTTVLPQKKQRYALGSNGIRGHDMPDSRSSWDVISDDDSSDLILCVDFPAAGRQAGFAQLARRIGSRYTFLQTRPRVAQPCQRLSAGTYISGWIDGAGRKGLRVRAILGHGIGAVYAAAIAEGLARWQPPPEVILLDPHSANLTLLASEFRKEINGLSSLLSDDEIERIGAVVSEMCKPAEADLEAAAAEMAGAYTELGSLAYQRVGVGDACGSRFLASFESYITWITVAGQIDPSFSWQRSVALVSADYGGRADQPCGQPGPIGRVIPLDIGHADLLRADCVAHEVRRLLGCPN